MAGRRSLCLFLVFSLLANAFSAPNAIIRWRRQSMDNELEPKDLPTSTEVSKLRDSVTDKATTYYIRSTAAPDNDDDDDDDDFDEPMQPAPTTGGSNIFSLLRLASALLPGLSGGDSPIYQNMLRELYTYNNKRYITRRQDIGDNEIEIDYTIDLKPPPLTFQRHETDDNNERESSESDEDDNDDDSEGDAEVLSSENDSNDNDSGSKQDSESNGNDSDYDEPPEGDGQGGGILGILAGLSGGEDGQSDLGSLLATVSGIVANLSGDGIDLNSLIASGIGLFAGLLSEGEENPGAVIASYLLTSLDTITGGGAQNNGAFFGNLVSKLVKGTSASQSSGQSSSPMWTLKMSIMRAFLQFGASMLGSASAASSNTAAT